MLDDRKGSANQAEGIALALKGKIEIVKKNIVYTCFGSFPNYIRGRTLIGVNRDKSDDITPPWPDLVLSSTRRVPQHDKNKNKQSPKSLVITGAPTKIFADILAKEQKNWMPVFDNLPKPLTAVIIGGAIKNKPWPLDNAEDLAKELKNLHKKIGGSFLITSSRRTGKQAEKIIMNEIKDIPCYTYLWGEKKENPIMGFYACADLIVATADSVSMCSEACGTGKPVLLFIGHDWLTPKHCRFAKSLIEKGYAVDMKQPEAINFRPKAILNDANFIAIKISEISQT